MQINIQEIIEHIDAENQEYDALLEDVMNDFFDGDTTDYDRLVFWVSMYPQYRQQLEDASVTSCYLKATARPRTWLEV